MLTIASCPFCDAVNRFGENKRFCPHLLFTLGEKGKRYAVFREEKECKKALIEEESDENN